MSIKMSYATHSIMYFLFPLPATQYKHMGGELLSYTGGDVILGVGNIVSDELDPSNASLRGINAANVSIPNLSNSTRQKCPLSSLQPLCKNIHPTDTPKFPSLEAFAMVGNTRPPPLEPQWRSGTKCARLSYKNFLLYSSFLG